MDLTATPSAEKSAPATAASLRSIALAILCVAACCGAAIFNGLPLVLPDTAAYLASGANLTVPWDRPIFYGLFMRPFLFANLWPVIVAQCGITIYVLRVAARVASADMNAARFAAVALAVCLFSTLPWVAGQLMPDIFAAISVLGVYIIFFGGQETSRLERVAIWVLTAFAVSTHLSHIPLFAALVAACALCRLFLYGRQDLLRRVGSASAVLALAIAAILASNFIQSGRPALSRGGGLFVVAKLLESGAVQSYLAEACPGSGFALCGVAGELPRDVNAFLWVEDSTLRRIDRPEAVMDEAGTVAFNTLTSFPLPIIEHSALSAFRQLMRFSTGGGETSDSLSALLDHADLGQRFREAALASRQGRDALPFAQADILNGIGLLIALGSTACLLWIGIRPAMLALLLTILAGVLANAIVCGALSIVDDRYQARVVWLLPFFGMLAILETWDRWRRSTPEAPEAS